MSPVTLPPPSDALSVHAAAAHLRRVAELAAVEQAADPYWMASWFDAMANALGGAAGDLAGLFSPASALAVADWLDECASANARHGTEIPAAALAITAATHPAP